MRVTVLSLAPPSMKRARDELPAPAVANANGDGNEPAIDDSPSAKRPRCSDEHRDDPLPQPLMLALHARLARRSSHDNNDDNDEHRELQQIRIVERDGQRFIEPYYHVFRAFVKRRWHLRTAQQVFSAEFHAFPSDYWPLAFEHRRIGVNGSPILPDTVLRESDALTHIVHRHERAITTDKIRVRFTLVRRPTRSRGLSHVFDLGADSAAAHRARGGRQACLDPRTSRSVKYASMRDQSLLRTRLLAGAPVRNVPPQQPHADAGPRPRPAAALTYRTASVGARHCDIF